MPVYERGYTHWEPSERRALPAWLVIAKRGIAGPLKLRWLLFLILIAWVPAIVKGGIIFFKLKAGDIVDLAGGEWTSIDPAGFLNFLEKQRFAAFLLMAITGAGLIATDRRDNGLSLYFSRPLGLSSYLAGKVVIVLFFYFAVTLAPVLVLCLFAYLIAPDATGMDLLLVTPLRTIVYCVLSGTSLSLVLLAFSSLGQRSIFVMVWWTILVMGTDAIAAAASGVGQNSLELLNFFGQYHNAGALLFGTSARLGVSSWLSLAVALIWTALAILVLRKRIRPVEVVS